MAANSTLSEKVYNEIYEDIVNQQLVCGEKLTLKGLGERYGCSYTPVREALAQLKEVGLVDYYSNSGVKVIDFTPESIRDIFRFMGELDAMAIRLAGNGKNNSAMLFELEQVIEESNRLLSEGKSLEWKAVSQEFHKIFYNYADSACLNDAAKRLRPRIELLSIMYYKDTNISTINQDHINIFAEIEKGNSAAAAELMVAHLQYDMVFAVKAFEQYKKQSK